jgi:hypothetical protein
MKYDPEPGWWLWWDTGPRPIHREDGTRYKRRIDYWAIPLHDEFNDIPGIHHFDHKKQLKARKLLWRRLRHGYYDRNYDKHIPKPPRQWDKHGCYLPEPVPRCGARCRNGRPCRARVVCNKYTGKPSNRCKWHGGHSTGPRTEAGKAASLAALARGRAKRSKNVA